MADNKFSALPDSGLISSGDKIVCLASGVAKLVTPRYLFLTSFAPDTAPTLADAFVVQGQTDGDPELLTLQQLANTDSLLANDASPADTDKLRVNQAGVAKTLAVSALRAQLDAFASARNVQASQISLSTGSALQLPLVAQLGGTTASFPALKRSGQILQGRLADDSGWAGVACGTLGVYRVSTENIVLSSGSYYIGIFAESGQPSLRFSVTSNAENNHDIMLSRAAAGVLSVDGSTLGDAAGQIKCAGATGAGAATLGGNCPAVTATAPYTWLKHIAPDGSQVYVPAWK